MRGWTVRAVLGGMAGRNEREGCAAGRYTYSHRTIVFKFSLLLASNLSATSQDIDERLTCPWNNQWLLCSSMVRLAGAFLNFFMTARAKRWWLYMEVAMLAAVVMDGRKDTKMDGCTLLHHT
jgi:hypothetical protein